jgi:hypothetical protein
MRDTERLRASIPDDVRAISARLAEAGHRSWAVGGSIRDEDCYSPANPASDLMSSCGFIMGRYFYGSRDGGSMTISQLRGIRARTRVACGT